MTEKPSSVFVTYIVTTPEKLWDALTNGDITQQDFFGRRMESDWKVCSSFKLVMADGRIDSQGKVLEADPPRRLAVTWHVEWMEDFRQLPEAIVTFQIDPLGDVVRFTVSEFHPAGIKEKYLEGGHPRRDRIADPPARRAEAPLQGHLHQGTLMAGSPCGTMWLKDNASIRPY